MKQKNAMECNPYNRNGCKLSLSDVLGAATWLTLVEIMHRNQVETN